MRVLTFLTVLYTVLTLPAVAIQLPIRNYTTADGLPRNAVFCIVPDSQGFLWFCTTDGLSRFDGAKFDNFSTAQGLPDRNTQDFLRTRAGTLIAATNQGVSRVDTGAATGSRRQFVPIPRRDGQPSLAVFELFQDSSDNVWAGTVGGLYRVANPDSPRPSLEFISLGDPNRSPVAFANDGLGGMWIGTRAGLGHRSSTGELQWNPIPRAPVAINTLLLDRERRLWIGTLDGLYLAENPSAPTITAVYQQAHGLGSGRIHSLFQSSAGVLWAGTAAGLSELVPAPTPAGYRFRNYSAGEGLRGRTVLALAESADGSLWAGVDHALARIARNGFLRYSESDGIGDLAISTMFEDAGGNLFAVSNEPAGPLLHRFDGRKFSSIRPRYPASIHGSGSGIDQVALIDHTGDWWFATSDGLVRFPAVPRAEVLARTPPKAIYTTRDGLPTNDIGRIFEDSRGDVWISAKTLVHYIRSTGRFETLPGTPEDGFPSAFAEDPSGAVWIAFSSAPGTGHPSQLLRYRNARLETVEAGNLPTGWFTNLHFDRSGRLWLATTEGGLALAAEPTSRHPQFGLQFTPKNGLSGPGVLGLAEDRRGRLYATTAYGVDSIDPDSKAIRHFSYADGVPTGISFARSDRAGTLWFGAAMGLASYSPAAEPAREPAPAVIKAVRVNGQPRVATQLRLNAAENQLQFDFAAPAAPASASARFQYKLGGADEDWNSPTPDTSVNYSNLPPGRYRFQVRPVSLSLDTLPAAELAFEIEPHFWQRWWFVALVAVALASVAWFWHRYDVDRRLEVALVRSRIAADLHDDLGASLSRVVILSEVAQRQASPSDSAIAPRLREIAETARALVDGMGDLVWSIDPHRDGLASLLARLRQFASGILDPLGIQWTLESSPDVEQLPLSPDRRWQLFLILKEAIHNAARHSGCECVRIEFLRWANQAIVRIVDDGRGLPSSSHPSSGGNGLANIAKRATALGAQLSIESEPGHGVEIVLSLPWEKSRRGA